MAKSFIAGLSPSRSRTKVIDWPFPVDGETPRVRMRVLGADKLEAANLETVAHFAKAKPPVKQTDPAFVARERTALVYYAFEAQDDKGAWEPIASSIDELAAEPEGVIAALFAEWTPFQADITARPMSAAQMNVLVEELKKNTQEVPLGAMPSSWLIALCRTLAGQLASSTSASGHG